MLAISNSTKLKILLLADDKSANTLSWVRALQNAGCEVTIVSARAPKSYDNVISLGMNYLPARLKFLFGTKRLKKIIKEISPDILIGYRITSYGYLAATSKFHPLILAAQNEQIIRLPFYAFFVRPFITLCVKYALNRADLIHSWGNNIKEGLLRFGASPEKIYVKHRGINLNIFKPDERKEISINRSPVLISTRSLYKDYRIDLLIKVFAYINQKWPDAILKIIGEGPERSSLEFLALNLNIRRKVIFYKYTDSETTASLLRTADIYVSLIKTEGISSSLIEACACGVFPIVVDMKASRELIKNKENGLLLTSDDPVEISNLICEAYEDIELRRRAYTFNQKFVKENFDVEKNCEEFIKKYYKIKKKYN